jgi:hypothetical protein
MPCAIVRFPGALWITGTTGTINAVFVINSYLSRKSFLRDSCIQTTLFQLKIVTIARLIHYNDMLVAAIPAGRIGACVGSLRSTTGTW